MHIVLRAVVDVHQHVVLQVLPRGGVVQVGPVSVVVHGQTGGQHVALVVALTVAVGVERLTTRQAHLAVGEAVLLDILVVGRNVEQETLCGLPLQTGATSGLVSLVGMVARGGVVEEALLSLVEAS